MRFVPLFDMDSEQVTSIMDSQSAADRKRLQPAVNFFVSQAAEHAATHARFEHRPSSIEAIASLIRVTRGQKVILDADLARLYGVQTRRLNEQVRRNSQRFPGDFAFQLDSVEFEALMSQFATSNTPGRGGRRKPPLVFTEHGTLMAAMVLNSPRASEVSVYVVRAFVRMRELVANHEALANKLTDLELRIDSQDQTIVDILGAIRQLMAPPTTPARRPIGFIHTEERRK